jgi:hypothetical protein
MTRNWLYDELDDQKFIFRIPTPVSVPSTCEGSLVFTLYDEAKDVEARYVEVPIAVHYDGDGRFRVEFPEELKCFIFGSDNEKDREDRDGECKFVQSLDKRTLIWIIDFRDWINDIDGFKAAVKKLCGPHLVVNNEDTGGLGADEDQ